MVAFVGSSIDSAVIVLPAAIDCGSFIVFCKIGVIFSGQFQLYLLCRCLFIECSCTRILHSCIAASTFSICTSGKSMKGPEGTRQKHKAPETLRIFSTEASKCCQLARMISERGGCYCMELQASRLSWLVLLVVVVLCVMYECSYSTLSFSWRCHERCQRFCLFHLPAVQGGICSDLHVFESDSSRCMPRLRYCSWLLGGESLLS
mmetsp:Transcript_32818/g.69233  ORF Transcript_32818/g.69233 Transcript_32818/m.69233 type:complete len:205 (-) Transcript_32818:76-690(-)